MKKVELILLFVLIPLFSFAQLEDTKFTIIDGLDNASLKTAMEHNVSLFLKACNVAVMEGDKPEVDKELTDDAKDVLKQMWKTSPMACPVSSIEEICLETSDGYQVRNIPVTMMAAEEGEGDQELVLHFTSSGAIDNISIAIEENKYKEILSEHESVEDLYRRQVIIDFVENYRTAYNRKDLPYIESVFSDNALIITGKVIREKPKSDYAMRALSHEKIVYQKRIELWGEGQSFFDIKRLNMSVTRGYEGTNFGDATRFNTNGRPAWMNLTIVRLEEDNNPALKGWNNPDPSEAYSKWVEPGSEEE